LNCSPITCKKKQIFYHGSDSRATTSRRERTREQRSNVRVQRHWWVCPYQPRVITGDNYQILSVVPPLKIIK